MQWHTNPQRQTSETSQIQQMTPQMREDTAAVSFLAMAEQFRSNNQFKESAKCLIVSFFPQMMGLTKSLALRLPQRRKLVP